MEDESTDQQPPLVVTTPTQPNPKTGEQSPQPVPDQGETAPPQPDPSDAAPHSIPEVNSRSLLVQVLKILCFWIVKSSAMFLIHSKSWLRGLP